MAILSYYILQLSPLLLWEDWINVSDHCSNYKQIQRTVVISAQETNLTLMKVKTQFKGQENLILN